MNQRCNIQELDKPFRNWRGELKELEGCVEWPGPDAAKREQALPDWCQALLYALRWQCRTMHENVEPKNRELRALRSEVRLLRRVMRLKNEASVQGAEAALLAANVGAGMPGDL